MTKMKATPKSYEECKNLLNGKVEMKLGNNTKLVCSVQAGAFAIKFHDTEVVRFYVDGTVQIQNGGHQTTTTKDRINQFIPRGYVFQRSYNWYYHHGGKDFQFQNGMLV